MKFSYVFVFLATLFAISSALPANWAEQDEELSDVKAVKEKRIFTWLATKAARAALGYALRKVCDMQLPDNVKPICNCVSLVAGDEEAEVKPEMTQKRSLSWALGELKSAIQKACYTKPFSSLLSGPCSCITSFI